MDVAEQGLILENQLSQTDVTASVPLENPTAGNANQCISQPDVPGSVDHFQPEYSELPCPCVPDSIIGDTGTIMPTDETPVEEAINQEVSKIGLDTISQWDTLAQSQKAKPQINHIRKKDVV